MKRACSLLATAYNRHDRFRKPAVMTPQPARKLSHLDAKGRPAMVDVSAKAVTAREAVAACRVKFPAAVAAQLRASGLQSAKGGRDDTAIIAGTMAVHGSHEQRTFCPPPPINGVHQRDVTQGNGGC